MENSKQLAFATASETIYQSGLTKREYFAGLAMQGLLTRMPKRDKHEEPFLGMSESDRISQESVIMADKLLEQLENS